MDNRKDGDFMEAESVLAEAFGLEARFVLRQMKQVVLDASSVKVPGQTQTSETIARERDPDTQRVCDRGWKVLREGIHVLQNSKYISGQTREELANALRELIKAMVEAGCSD